MAEDWEAFFREVVPEADVAAIPRVVMQWVVTQAKPEDLRVLQALIERRLEPEEGA